MLASPQESGYDFVKAYEGTGPDGRFLAAVTGVSKWWSPLPAILERTSRQPVILGAGVF